MARRRLIRFVALGIGAYVFALIATLPASVVFKNRPWRTGVSGTVWNGEVGLTGGIAMRWGWEPLRSITSLGYAASWKATGPDTDLGGRALVHLGGTTSLDKVSGSADASLLQTLQPDLPFTCDFAEQIEMEKIVTGTSDAMMKGQVISDAGSCMAKGGGAPVAVPALQLVAEKVGSESRIRVTPLAQRRKLLISAVLQPNGTLDVTVTPDGAAMLPFLGVPGGTRVQGKL